jgi:hypothetical protein
MTPSDFLLWFLLVLSTLPGGLLPLSGLISYQSDLHCFPDTSDVLSAILVFLTMAWVDMVVLMYCMMSEVV